MADGKRMRNIVISDGSFDEMQPFMKGINSVGVYYYDLNIYTANWLRTGKWSEIKRYVKYFTTPINYFINRSSYSIIVGWQQFYALIYCFYCSLFHVKKHSTVVALNYTYKEKSGKLGGIYKWFMRKCMDLKYLDFIHVLSQNTAEIISREFVFPLDRIIVAAFGIKDRYEELYNLARPKGYETEKYFFSIGRSNRDYNFLISAWDGGGTGCRLIIASDTFEGNSTNPLVTIRRDIGGEEQYSWITNAEAVILPIDNPDICSGDTVLLTAMSLKKIVIVTEPSTLVEMYIRNKENALTVRKQSEDLQKVIREIIDGKYKYLQDDARKSFLKDFSREKMGAVIGTVLKNQN